MVLPVRVFRSESSNQVPEVFRTLRLRLLRLMSTRHLALYAS